MSGFVFRLCAALVATAAVACGGSPTSPRPALNAGTIPSDPPPAPGSHVVTGSIINALDDAAAAHALFRVNDTVVGHSEANGTFTVGFPGPLHRSVRMHELGHALGCQHVTNRASVMNSHAR